jgi:hypothetical protein
MTRTTLALLLPFLLPLAPQDPGATSVQIEPVCGIVVDEAGQPLGGVRWWVSGHETLQDGQWVVTHFLGLAKIETTGADGRFELPGRPDLRYDVDLDADGFAPAFQRQLEPGAQPRVVLRRGHTVSGRVVQLVDGQERPLHVVPIELQRPNERGLWFSSQRTTELDGSFAFRHFLPGEPDRGAPEAWSLVCAGASLELDPERSGPIEDLKVEISITREGR